MKEESRGHSCAVHCVLRILGERFAESKSVDLDKVLMRAVLVCFLDNV